MTFDNNLKTWSRYYTPSLQHTASQNWHCWIFDLNKLISLPLRNHPKLHLNRDARRVGWEFLEASSSFSSEEATPWPESWLEGRNAKLIRRKREEPVIENIFFWKTELETGIREFLMNLFHDFCVSGFFIFHTGTW